MNDIQAVKVPGNVAIHGIPRRQRSQNLRPRCRKRTSIQQQRVGRLGHRQPVQVGLDHVLELALYRITSMLAVRRSGQLVQLLLVEVVFQVGNVVQDGRPVVPAHIAQLGRTHPNTAVF